MAAADLLARVIDGELPPVGRADAVLEALDKDGLVRAALREAVDRHGARLLVVMAHEIASRLRVLDCDPPLPPMSPAERAAVAADFRGALRLPWTAPIARAALNSACEVQEILAAHGIDLSDAQHVLAVVGYGYRLLLQEWCAGHLVLLAQRVLGDQVEAVTAIEVAVAAELPPSVAHAISPQILRGIWLRDPRGDPSSGLQAVDAAARRVCAGVDLPPAPCALELVRQEVERSQREVLRPADPEADRPWDRAWRGVSVDMLGDILGHGPRADSPLWEILGHWRREAYSSKSRYRQRDDGGRNMADLVVEEPLGSRAVDPKPGPAEAKDQSEAMQRWRAARDAALSRASKRERLAWRAHEQGKTLKQVAAAARTTKSTAQRDIERLRDCMRKLCRPND